MQDARSGRLGGAGLVLGVTSAAAFGTSGVFAAALMGAGWTPGAAVAVRVLLAAVVLTAPALWQLRGRWGLLRRGGRTVVAFGVFAVAGSQLCYFNAVAHVPVGVALLVEYLGVLLVVGWLWLRHGQRPRRLTLAGGAVAVTGLALVLNLAGAGRPDPVGVFWALGAAVGLASYFVLTARVDDGLPPLVVAWGVLLVGGVTLLAGAAAGLLPLRAPLVDVELAGAQVSWLVPAVGLVVVAAVLAYLAGIVSARALGARVASFVGLTEVLFAVLGAWLLLGQVPLPVQLLGGAFVVAGIVLVRLGEPSPAAAPPAADGGQQAADTDGSMSGTGADAHRDLDDIHSGRVAARRGVLGQDVLGSGRARDQGRP